MPLKIFWLSHFKETLAVIYLALRNLIICSPKQRHSQRIHVHLWGGKHTTSITPAHHGGLKRRVKGSLETGKRCVKDSVLDQVSAELSVTEPCLLATKAPELLSAINVKFNRI